MKLQNGFVPFLVLFVSAVVITATIGGYSVFSRFKDIENPKKTQKQKPVFSLEEFSFSSPTPSPKPTIKPLPTRVPVSPTSTTTSISVYAGDNGIAITDPSIYFFLRNEESAQEQMVKNSNSGSWTLSNLSPGKYKMYVSYSYNNFMNIDKKCEGCQNNQEISSPGSCGYIFDLKAGNNVRLSCTLRPVKPLTGGQTANNQLSNDTMPPNTNIYYPQPNGSITYKIDGKICAIATQPNDNSGPEGIETEYRFDNDNWSGYAGGRGYLCASSLSNGPHTLSYHSKDWAGNVETTKTISFSVNIPGN
jgi:hypothetical protein